MSDKIVDKYLQEHLSKRQMLPSPILDRIDELSGVQSRWTGILRHHGHKMIEAGLADNISKPDLFNIANEIDAFFAALKINK